MTDITDRVPRSRNRLCYMMGCFVVIGVGLASRELPLLQTPLGKYPGDALWALMVFLGWGSILVRTSTLRLACLGLGSAYLVEFSQLYHAAWIDAIRDTTLGGLVLGSSFHPLDLLAYAVGVSIGVLIEWSCLITAARGAAPPPPRRER